MREKFQPQFKELQDLRRKGVSLSEFWEQILNSPRLTEIWEESQEQGTLDILMWQFLLSPTKKVYLLQWEKQHPSSDPTLIHWWKVLSFYPVSIRKEAIKFLGKLDLPKPWILPYLVQAIEDADYSVCRKATEVIRLLGSNAALAIPNLIDKMTSPYDEIRQRATLALIDIGEEAIPSLIEMLQRSDTKLQKTTLQALGALKAQKAIPLILTYLKAPTDALRYTAAWSLGKISNNQAEIVNALIEALTDRNEIVRTEAAQALGEIGEPIAFAPLIPLLKDKVQYVRMASFAALKAIKGEAKEILPALFQALKDSEEDLRQQTLTLLKQQNFSSQEQLALIEEFLPTYDLSSPAPYSQVLEFLVQLLQKSSPEQKQKWLLLLQKKAPKIGKEIQKSFKLNV